MYMITSIKGLLEDAMDVSQVEIPIYIGYA